MFRFLWPATALACIALAGCASVSRDASTRAVDNLLEERGLPAPAWSKADAHDARVRELLSGPVTRERAIQLAFIANAQLRAAYADLGIGQADVVEASRLANPRLGYADLDSDQEGGQSKITRSLSIDFADLLLLPARRRLAAAQLDIARERIGGELVDLAAQVERAWFEYVSAQQVAAMRDAAAQTAEASAEFARRSREAGNISPRNLALELAAASRARIAAAEASAEAVQARARLADLLGVSAREPWRTPDRLPAPLAAHSDEKALLELALEQRLDVARAEREVAFFARAANLSRRWRFIGDVEVGYERESEDDGTLSGPTLSLGLPLFHQGQASVLRTQSQLEAARARQEALGLTVRNEIASRLDRVSAARQIAERYRDALIPQREAVVARTLEEYNFMLTGVYEILQARREELDAYQEYLEAVRDYWVARTELRQAAGGRLPDDDAQPEPTLGVDSVPGTPDTRPETPGHHEHQESKPDSTHEHETHDHPEHEEPLPPPDGESR